MAPSMGGSRLSPTSRCYATRRRGCAKSENRLRAITDNLPIAIALYDRADRVQFANQEYRELAAKSDRPPNGAASADYQYKEAL